MVSWSFCLNDKNISLVSYPIPLRKVLAVFPTTATLCGLLLIPKYEHIYTEIKWEFIFQVLKENKQREQKGLGIIETSVFQMEE